MATGFPQARLERRLDDIAFELGQWVEQYVEEIQDARPERMVTLDERIDVLRKAQEQLTELQLVLARMPRMR